MYGYWYEFGSYYLFLGGYTRNIDNEIALKVLFLVSEYLRATGNFKGQIVMQVLDPNHGRQQHLHDLCLEVLTVHGTKFWANAFPPIHTINAVHWT